MIVVSSLYIKEAHPKVQCNPALLYFYTLSMIVVKRLYFKVAHPKVQCNPAFFALLHSFYDFSQ